MDTSILSEKAQARLNEIKQQVRAKMKANVPKRTFSLETRQKMSLAAKRAAENMSPENKQKMREKMSLSAKIAVQNMSPETKKKRREKIILAAKTRSSEAKQKMREKMSLAAKNRSPETKQKMIEQMSQILTCTHCGKVGKGIVMYRYHFDNCKQKA